jgi:heme exporter protein D
MIDFLSQGDYAFFVWGAYGMTLALLVAEILQLRAQRRTILARLGRLIRMRDSGVNQ